jgi:hypothetical protein
VVSRVHFINRINYPIEEEVTYLFIGREDTQVGEGLIDVLRDPWVSEAIAGARLASTVRHTFVVLTH